MKDENQERAIQHTEGPLLIIAGPGSGKTRTLVERVLFLLLQKEIAPSAIFLSTFTEKAARELRQRIQAALQKAGADMHIEEMYLGTMHSLWLRLLEEKIEYSHYDSGIAVMDEEEEQFFLYSQCREMKKLPYYEAFFKEEGIYGDWAQSRFLLKLFHRIDEEAVDVASLRSFEEAVLFLQQAYALYEELLWRANAISFSYLQKEALYVFRQGDCLEEIQEKLRYFMIDEYQDSNPIQEKLLFYLSKKERNLCVVGDDDQSIYRFRGAKVENILLFPQHFPEAKIILLEKNYRSTEDIVSLCKSWIERIDWAGNRYDKTIYSARYESLGKKSVFRISASANSRKRRELIDFVKCLKTEGKIEDYSQVVFLFDNFRSPRVKNLEEDFEAAGIPVYCPRARNFFYRKEVKLAIGLFLALYPETKELIQGWDYYPGAIFLARQAAKENQELLDWIVEKRKEEGGDFLEDFYHILSFSPLREILEEQEEDPRRGRSAYNLSLLAKLIAKFQKLCKIKVGSMQKREAYLSYFVTQYLRKFIQKGMNEFESKAAFPKDCLPFLTIHQAKGLEFSLVFMGSLEKSVDRYQEREEKIYEQIFYRPEVFQEKNQELYDFYRKYYVAFSRAKNALVFLDDKPSPPFLYFVRHAQDVREEGFSWEDIPAEPYEEEEGLRQYSYTRDLLIYGSCPLRYFFLERIGFPGLEKEGFLFGTVLHRCLESLQRRDSLEGLEGIIQKEKKKAEAESKFVLEEGSEERIAELIKDYWAKRHSLFDEIVSVEAKEYRQEEERLLYGELDVLAKQEGAYKIIDFKTGGEKASYREQLLYYAYLFKKYPESKGLKTSLYYLLEGREEEVTATKEEEEELYANWEERFKEMEAKEFPRKPGEGCSLCEFQSFCERKEGL